MSDGFRDILEKFEQAEIAEKEQRRLAIKDLLFVESESGQWDENAIERRANRPRYTIDRISPAIDQIIGDYRQNQTGIKVLPQHGADEKTARIFTGLIRSIEQLSNAQNSYDLAFADQVKCGFGGWRILTEYETDESFEQKIIIKPLTSVASSLYYEPMSCEYAREDSDYLFYVSRVPRSLFKQKYPNASIVDFTNEEYSDSIYKGWFEPDIIRVAEYWYKQPYQRKIGLLSDGRTIDLEEEKDVLDELAARGIQIIRERKINSYKIQMLKMNGAEVLDGPTEWAGKYFPFVPLWGKQSIIEGRRFTRGIVRKSIDAQRIYNYATSSAIEATALTPKDPIWITAHQAKGYEKQLNNFPTQNSPFMLYNSDPNAPGMPQRGGAPQLQSALLAQVDQSARDIYSTTGLEPASMGNSPELKSGKAILAQQAMGDRGSFIFQSNFEKSKEYTGKVLIDLIPRIYDTERIVKIVGVDDNQEDIVLNERQFDELNDPIIDEQTGKQVIVNDLSQGEYSVAVTTGPAFATQRQETAEQLTQLASNSEIIQKVGLDIILDNLNLNKGEELKKRVRRIMIQEGLIEPTEDEVKEYGLDQQPPRDPMQDALMENVQIQTEKLIADIRNKDADTQQKIYDAQQKTIETLKALKEMVGKQLEAGIAPSSNDADIIEGQQAIAEEGQIAVLQNNELAESALL